MIKLCTPSPDKKVESLNKNLLLSHKCDINFARQTTELLTNVTNDLIIFQLVLTQDEKQVEKQVKFNCMQIVCILSLYESVIFDRRDTTTPEDFYSLFKWISSDLMFLVLRKLSWCSCLSITFKVSNLLNSIIQSVGTKSQIKVYQTKMVNHSTLILE